MRLLRHDEPVVGGTIRCSECRREVDERTAIHERWGYWPDGCGELLPFCPECARREFAADARSSERQLPVQHRDATTSDS